MWDERGLPEGDRAPKLHRFVHFWIMVWQSFSRNRCPVRASALAYATLLTLIPLLAVVMSITSTFLKQEGEDRIDQFVTRVVDSLVPPAELSTNLQAKPTLENTNGPVANSSGTPTNNSSATATTNWTAGAAGSPDGVIRDRHEIARKIHGFIQNTRSGTLGVTGSVLLIFAAISLLSRIEVTFNDIWGVARGRSWFMRVVL